MINTFRNLNYIGMLGKLGKIISLSFIILFSTIVLFEVCYRFYLIDFYNVEDNYFNKTDIVKGKTILFFGDSFTASNNNYISMLRDSFPKYNIINAAVPGIGIRETAIFASTRIKQYKPDIVVFQVYTGNDFTDIKHDLNFYNLSLIRNLYWFFSDKFLGIRYINYKLGQFKKTENYHFKEQEIFDSNTYSPWQKILINSHPSYIEESIKMQEPQKSKIEIWFKQFNKIIKKMDSKIKIYILLIPHCAQVNMKYIEKMKSIDAVILDTNELLNSESSLIQYFNNQCESRNVIFMNPLETLQHEELDGNSLFYENDIHLNNKGNEVLGIFLYFKLNEINLINDSEKFK